MQHLKNLCRSSSPSYNTQTHTHISHLVCIFQLQTRYDLTFQLCVILGFAQNALTEFWDVSFAGLPKYWVQTIV